MKQAGQLHFKILSTNSGHLSLIGLIAKLVSDAPDVWVQLKPNTLLGNLAIAFNREESEHIQRQQLSKDTDFLMRINKINEALEQVRAVIQQTQHNLESATFGEHLGIQALNARGTLMATQPENVQLSFIKERTASEESYRKRREELEGTLKQHVEYLEIGLSNVKKLEETQVKLKALSDLFAQITELFTTKAGHFNLKALPLLKTLLIDITPHVQQFMEKTPVVEKIPLNQHVESALTALSNSMDIQAVESLPISMLGILAAFDPEKLIFAHTVQFTQPQAAELIKAGQIVGSAFEQLLQPKVVELGTFRMPLPVELVSLSQAIKDALKDILKNPKQFEALKPQLMEHLNTLAQNQVFQNSNGLPALLLLKDALSQ